MYLCQNGIPPITLQPQTAKAGNGRRQWPIGVGVNVVDYKTGKPKSRNAIDGKVASSDGDYRRQLVFYNLLLNKYDGGKYRMHSGEIDFIEPDEKGRYHKHLFTIEPSEVSELAELIIKVSGEIVNLEFCDRYCDDVKCEFCGLRRVML